MESASATLPWCFVLAAVVARFPHTSASAQAARSPPIIYGNIEPVVAISGESVKLYCPVGGDPTPFYEWFKNGEEILGDDVYADARNRIRIMGHALKIKRTRAEDSGIYECRAINGFGTVTVEVELFVQNKSEILSNDYVSNRERMSTPRIVEKSVSEQNDGVFRLSPGTDFRLRCVVLGDPLPTVRWFREGMELKTGGWRDKSNSRWSHIFQPLRTSDSGEYSCRASSKSGQAAANFTVIVQEKIAGKSQTSSPVHALVTSSEFVNQSAIMGTNVALSCEVKSDSRLLLHWVKRVEESAEDRGAADADLIVFEGHSYRDVNGSSVMGSTDPSSGRPRLEVTLESVRRDTAGVYVCLATNDVGGRFQVKSVHLIVSETAPPRASMEATEPQVSNPAFILLAAAAPLVLIFAAGTAVWCLCRRKSTGVEIDPENSEGVKGNIRRLSVTAHGHNDPASEQFQPFLTRNLSNESQQIAMEYHQQNNQCSVAGRQGFDRDSVSSDTSVHSSNGGRRQQQQQSHGNGIDNSVGPVCPVATTSGVKIAKSGRGPSRDPRDGIS